MASKLKRDKDKTRQKQQKDLRFHGLYRESLLVLIRWLFAGQRLEEAVPLRMARHRRNELEAQGAIVYWSERLLGTH